MSTFCGTTLHLRRIDPSRNMARFYVASVEPSLLPGTSLRRAWGRIGTQGRSRIDLFDDPSAAEQALNALKRQKLKRGYVDMCEAL